MGVQNADLIGLNGAPLGVVCEASDRKLSDQQLITVITCVLSLFVVRTLALANRSGPNCPRHQIVLVEDARPPSYERASEDICYADNATEIAPHS